MNLDSSQKKIRDVSNLPNKYDAYTILRTTDGSEVILDFQDYLKCSKLSWHTMKTSENYKRIYHKNSDNSGIYIHRFILNPNEGEIVDHINGDTLDNRKINLRITDHSGNARNHGLNKNNSTGYKGVSYCSDGRFRSYITVDRKQIGLGSFKNIKEAARAYNNAAIKYFGEFARLNNVTD